MRIKVKARTKRKGKKGKHGPKRKTKVETITLGAASYVLNAPGSRTLAVKLSKTARELLAHAGHHSLKVTASAKQLQGTTVTRTVKLTLTLTKPKHKKHKHKHKHGKHPKGKTK